jgi:hypothetical protein
MPHLNTAAIDRIVAYLSESPTLAASDQLGPDEWDTIAVTAIALGLAPLLHWRLSQLQVAVPVMAMAKLGITRQAHAKRNEAIGQQLAELLAKFAQHKLAVLVLKGALLAATAYPEAALRPMNDIDLLFRPEDLGRVEPIFEELGYSGKHKETPTGPGVVKHLSTYRRSGNHGDTPNPYLSATGDRMVEPHGSLEEAWFGLKVDITPGVWERAMPMTLHHQPAYRLGTPDLLLHLTVHAAFHVIMGASVFVQLYDIGRVIEKWPAELNWPQFITQARQVQAQSFVYAGLFWAKRLFGSPIPETTLSSLQKECPADLAAYVQSLQARDILQRTQHPPLHTLSQRLRRGILDRQEAARWAGSLGQKWRVWQTALAFYNTDTLNLLTKRLKAQG